MLNHGSEIFGLPAQSFIASLKCHPLSCPTRCGHREKGKKAADTLDPVQYIALFLLFENDKTGNITHNPQESLIPLSPLVDHSGKKR